MAVDPVSLAITAAMMAAQMALTASQKIEGPRLDSLDVTIADYGTQIPRFWGRKCLDGVPIFWAERLREKKSTSKTKGGKYSEYRYYGTFAVLIADHEIDTVSRIWLDKHLCFDLTQAGPISVALGVSAGVPGAPVKLRTGKNLRVYLGTETQEPDPRMEAWCEDRYGADSCPAYRGYSYIVFEEIPLEKFGNRIPQVTVEAINNPTEEFLSEAVGDGGILQYARLSQDGSRLFVADSNHSSTGGFKIYDVATRTVIVSGNLDGGWSGNGSVNAIATDAIYSTNSSAGGEEVWRHSLDGSGGARIDFPLNTSEQFSGLDAIEDRVYFRAAAGSGDELLKLSGTEVVEIRAGFRATMHIADGVGNDWAVGTEGTTVHFYCMYGPRMGEAHSLASPTGSSAATMAVHNGSGGFVCYQSGAVFILDDEMFAVTDTGSWTATAHDYPAFNNIRQGAASIWIGDNEYSLTTLDLLRSIDFNDWVPSADVDRSFYEPALHAIWGESTSGARPQTLYYIDRIGSNGVTLKTVVDDVCDWCGLTGQDTTALTQTVQGYSVTQGSGKDMIAPLLDIHDVDPRPHDFSVEFKVRGSTALGTILTTEFAKDGDSPRYQVSITQDTDLPRKTLFNYADVNADQQKNTAPAQRPLDAMDGVGEQTIDLTTYVEDADNAQQFVDRYFRRVWNSRESIANSLTAQRLALEPADVWNLSLDGVVHTAKLKKLTIAGLMLNCEWVRDDPLLHNLNGASGAEMEGRDPDIIFIPLPTKGFALDIPLLADNDNSVNPIIQIGAGPYAPGGWSGAGFYQSDGTDYDTLFATVDSASKTGWGHTTTALGTTANQNIWDRSNTFTVVMNTGTLESHTEAEINADETLNMAVIGSGENWEVIQFATATLTGERTYLLSTLKRGRRGTGWAASTHSIGDEFILAEHLVPVELGASDIGDTLSFKAASIGRTIEEAPPIDVVFDGESHKPLSPVHVKGVRDFATNDWALSCIRRTRVGGRWSGTTMIPVGEAVESYKFKIMNGGSVVRTITDADGLVTYTSAQQVTDFGSAQSALTIKALQVGDLMDGRETTATF